MRRHPLLLIAPILCAVVGLSSGAAYAYFTSSGHGTGSGSVATLSGVTVTAFVGGDSVSTKLVPNQTADVILRVQNNNAFPVTLVKVISGPGSISVTGGSGCTAQNSGVSFIPQNSLNDPIASSGTTLVHLSGAAQMLPPSNSGCQGATFSIPVTITVEK